MADSAIQFLSTWLGSIWQVLLESAPFFVLGLILAGIIWLVMNEKNVARLIRDEGMTGILKAAAIGIPLPLCSCSVLPVASQLSRSGAGRGATVSFLISTPESGVDSILLTYSLTDPLLTIARPVTAFLTAIVAGFTETLFPAQNAPVATEGPECSDNCGCAVAPNNRPYSRWYTRVWSGVRYAFTDLLKDLAPSLFVGFVLAGLIGALLGADASHIPESLRTGWLGYAAAMVIGLPLYVCATSSTPLAAVLLASGFSPGAILVFLMVGPATNVATIVVVRKMLGFRATLRYVVSIAVVAIGAGLLLDHLYGWLNVTAAYRFGSFETGWTWLYTACAIVLAAFILYYTTNWLTARLRSFVLKHA